MRAFISPCALPRALEVFAVAIVALCLGSTVVAQAAPVLSTTDDDGGGLVLVRTEAHDEPVAGANAMAGGATLRDRPTMLVDGRPCIPRRRAGQRGRSAAGMGGAAGYGMGGVPGYGMGGAGANGMGTGALGAAGAGAGAGAMGGRVGTTTGQFAAGSQTNTAATLGGGAYLDLPFIVNQFRMRYDDAYDDNAPDRAEYFYAKCGCFRNPALPAGVQDPNAKGPTNAQFQAAQYVNYQAVRTYLEKRFSQRFSMFVEIPVQFDNIHFPAGSPNLRTGGLADINAGFKYALMARNDQYLTFQLRTYIPTGNPYLGLGTAHVSLEPSLLYWRTLSERAFIQGQLTDWIPIGGSNFSGDILQYGGAFGYVVYRRYDPSARSTPYAANLPPQVAPQNWFLITPLLEGVGWTALGGKEYIAGQPGPISAAGDTILNIKVGVRFTKGYNSVYTGWAHAITRDIWYRNMFRLEFRRFF